MVVFDSNIRTSRMSSSVTIALMVLSSFSLEAVSKPSTYLFRESLLRCGTSGQLQPSTGVPRWHCANVQWRHLGTDGFSMGASGHIPSKTTSESPGYPLAAGDSKQSPVRQMPRRAHQCPHAAIQMGPVWAYPQTPSRHACRPCYAE